MDQPVLLQVAIENLRLAQLREPLPVLLEDVGGVVGVHALQDVEVLLRESEYDVAVEACPAHGNELRFVPVDPLQPRPYDRPIPGRLALHERVHVRSESLPRHAALRQDLLVEAPHLRPDDLVQVPRQRATPETRNCLNSHSTPSWAMAFESCASSGCSHGGTFGKKQWA